ncbi:hypothetical protein BKA70DRAFT_709748 [Coprinopsis sp. MPI-PUGE-AT-0042]|nr:hypothetical protein BKA70DRAFT_709748 [Coprinopsis sp. MPI-PUGE-AT-0042]
MMTTRYRLSARTNPSWRRVYTEEMFLCSICDKRHNFNSFVVYGPDEVIEMIIALLNPRSLAKFRAAVPHIQPRISQVYWTRTVWAMEDAGITKPLLFQDLMARSGLAIFGHPAARVIEPLIPPIGHLDIAMVERDVEDFVIYLQKDERFTVVLESGTKSRMTTKFLNKTGLQYFSKDLVTNTLWLEKKRDGEQLLTPYSIAVFVLSRFSQPMCLAGAMPSTAFMVFVSAFGVESLYPSPLSDLKAIATLPPDYDYEEDPPVTAVRRLEPFIDHLRHPADYIGSHICGTDFSCPATVRASDGPGMFKVPFRDQFRHSTYGPWQEDALIWRLRSAAVCKPVPPSEPGIKAFCFSPFEPNFEFPLSKSLYTTSDV